MSLPFIILALPRSRTAWLSKFLSYGGQGCGHDLCVNSGCMQDFRDALAAMQGTVETAAIEGLSHLPPARIILVRRPLKDVCASLERLGLLSDTVLKQMQYRDGLLDDAEKKGIPSIPYADLDHEHVCEWLFEKCLGLSFDRQWWLGLKDQNIQIDMKQRMAELLRNQPAIANLRREVASASPITISVERWINIADEVEKLTAVHFEEVDGGVEPRRPYKPDGELIERINESGFFRIYVARQNGKMLGYICWTMHNDAESQGLLIAEMGPWFALPDSKAGTLLFDQSIADLKTLGVQCAYPHHRLQGRGAKLGQFFARRGAKEIEHKYSMWIGN